MTIEEIKSSFDEIRELRGKADEKERSILERLVTDGQIDAKAVVLLSSGVSFGGKSIVEPFVYSILKDDKKNHN